MRIIKDYDMYVERSLDRGFKREEIGISAIKAFRIKLNKKIDEFKKKYLVSKFDKNKKNQTITTNNTTKKYTFGYNSRKIDWTTYKTYPFGFKN